MIRDEKKIVKMRIAGKILSEILAEIREGIKVGATLLELDDIAMKGCAKRNVLPAFKGYEGFPSALCVGVNDTVVHGIPDEYVLKDGDMLSIDMGVKYMDVFSDSAYTAYVGEVSNETKRFVEATKKSLYEGIKQARPGKHVGDIGFAIQNVVENAGYSVVKEMVGHGIGYALHEEPYIPGYGEKGDGEKLHEGQTIAIEVIINQGTEKIEISKKDGWTSKTKDGMLSALFEHTVVVGQNPEILTDW